MWRELRRIFSKAESGMHMTEYFDLRRKRVSLAFDGIIFLSVLFLTPISFFILKSPTAGIGSCINGLLAITGGIFVLRDKVRLGSAIVLSGVGFVFLGILLPPALAHSVEYPAVLTSVLGLSLIVLVPTGLMVSGTYSLIFGICTGLGVVVCTTIAGSPELQGRRPVLLVIYLIAALVIKYQTSLQDSLLQRSVSEWEKSNDTLQSLSRMMERVSTLKKEADASAAAIAASFESVSSVMGAFMEKNAELFDASSKLEGVSEGAQGHLGTLLRSVEAISASVARQASLADEHSASQERMAAAFESIRSDVALADETTKKLATLAEEGKGTLERTIAGVKGLAEYQAQTLEIVGTLAKISHQTNMLAMNAAIEAAHAGSAGSGFAVVAESVRDLADSSGVRTKEISTIVKTMNGEIEASAQRIETVAASLFQVISETERAYELIANIARTMDAFSEDSRASLAGVRALADLAAAIKKNAEEERTVSAAFAETFDSLKRSLDVISAGIDDLNGHNEKSADILRVAEKARVKSESVNRAIDDLLSDERPAG